jgi:hypothetical protein
MKKLVLRGAAAAFVLSTMPYIYGCQCCCQCLGAGIPGGLTGLAQNYQLAPEEAPPPTVTARADGVAY